MTPIQILLVDDHPIVRQGIRSLLSNYPDFHLVGEVASVADALAWIQHTTADLVLLDIRMPDGSGLQVLRAIRATSNPMKVLIITSFDDDEYVLEALQQGADGYVLKNASDEMLVNAIRAVMSGEKVLSPQVTNQMVQHLLRTPPISTASDITPDEIEILRMLVQGDSNSVIAVRLSYSNATIKRKLRRIFDKLHVESRTEAAAEAIRRGLV
jgi:DNA-binding NarL/FixJ family response regulator